MSSHSSLEQTLKGSRKGSQVLNHGLGRLQTRRPSPSARACWSLLFLSFACYTIQNTSTIHSNPPQTILAYGAKLAQTNWWSLGGSLVGPQRLLVKTRVYQ